MTLANKFIIVLSGFCLLMPPTVYADIKIYFNTPTHQHNKRFHNRPNYRDQHHNRYQPYQRQRKLHSAYPSKRLYDNPYYKHNYRHHAIENSYYDYQQHKKYQRHNTFKKKRQHWFKQQRLR